MNKFKHYRDVRWWSVNDAADLRMWAEKVIRDREAFQLRMGGHGQVVGYEGDQPLETACNRVL